MAEFDIPGLAGLRGELTVLAASRAKQKTKSPLLGNIVRELYAEIREARLAGHGWGKMAAIIRKHTKCPCSQKTVRDEFNTIDAEWEKKTGVAAIEPVPAKKRGRPKNVQQMDKTA